MTFKVSPPAKELKPRIVVFGVGGAGGNAVNNMIESGLEGVEFVVANTDSQQLAFSKTDRRIQLGVSVTQGLGAGAIPRSACRRPRESAPEIGEHLDGAHHVFITAGMGGGTGTGAGPIIAKCARERGILTVGVVTKSRSISRPSPQCALPNAGIGELQRYVDTLIRHSQPESFPRRQRADHLRRGLSGMADQVLHSGVAIDHRPHGPARLINLDFAERPPRS